MTSLDERRNNLINLIRQVQRELRIVQKTEHKELTLCRLTGTVEHVRFNPEYDRFGK